MDSSARSSHIKMTSSIGGTEGSSPASSPASALSLAAMAAPKFGTLVPNRIFVGGISASTSEAELAQLFSAYGNVKATKIIADRGGVSKGYGFVTFETEEEAKRLQQESECIVLKERKLNIAPAIKKQPFNRSFDGGTGSPPAVPTSTYYYTNGMGLSYPSNGMTFYNTGVPGPNAAIATPTDSTTLYQATGVFGPQATTSHQTYAPVMYPVPAPSLYMPQQYQYSPMPYEPYFPGTSAAGGPQFLFATSGTQVTNNSGNSSGTSNNDTTATGTGTTSPPSAITSVGPSAPQYQTHFYGPTAATTPSHHHPGAITGAPHGLHPAPPHTQIEHLYYSYPPSPHATQPTPHHVGPLTLTADQQLLIYSTEISGHTSTSDSQFNHQEDTRSTSSHSEQLLHGGTATSDSGGGGSAGGEGSANSADPPVPSILPLMPLKYPLSPRYANFHPITVHSNLQQQQQQNQQTNPSHQQQQQTNDSSPTSNVEEYHRTMPLYSAPLYLSQNTQYRTTGTGNSLLPTPNQQLYDLGAGSCKFHDYSKSSLAAGSAFHRSGSCFKQYATPGLQTAAHVSLPAGPHKYPRVAVPPAHLSHQHYGRRMTMANQPQSQLAPTAHYFQQKSYQYSAAGPRTGQRLVYRTQPTQLSAYALQPMQKGFTLAASYECTDTNRRVPEGNTRQIGGRKNAILNSYRGSNLTIGTPVRAVRVAEMVEVDTTVSASVTTITTTTTTITTTVTTTMTNEITPSYIVNSSSALSESETKIVPLSSSENSSSPTSYSPVTHPLPILSPSSNPKQVQFFGSSCSSQRYSNPSSSNLSHQQQQQLRTGNNGSRYSTTTSVSIRGGKNSSVLRQSSAGVAKYKMNGIIQSSSGKLPMDEANLGGAGDAPLVGRLPITPPGTPQETSGEPDQHLDDACLHMQALNL